MIFKSLNIEGNVVILQVFSMGICMGAWGFLVVGGFLQGFFYFFL
jgi:hypothetical protein